MLGYVFSRDLEVGHRGSFHFTITVYVGIWLESQLCHTQAYTCERGLVGSHCTLMEKFGICHCRFEMSVVDLSGSGGTTIRSLLELSMFVDMDMDMVGANAMDGLGERRSQVWRTDTQSCSEHAQQLPVSGRRNDTLEFGRGLGFFHKRAGYAVLVPSLARRGHRCDWDGLVLCLLLPDSPLFFTLLFSRNGFVRTVVFILELMHFKTKRKHIGAAGDLLDLLFSSFFFSSLRSGAKARNS